MDLKINDLKKKYELESNLMSTKPRFGYFSIMPSHTAGKTDYTKTQCRKTPDGRVKTEARNIFSGSTSSGVLKKAFFSVPESIYQGDPYIKSKKINPNTKGNSQNQKQNNKSLNESAQQKSQIFIPTKLNKTLSSAAYPYILQNPIQKDCKYYKNDDGSVRTKLRNICTNSGTKITHQKIKLFQYTCQNQEVQTKLKNKELKKDLINKKQQPFKRGSPLKQYFSSNIEIFNDNEIKRKIKRVVRGSTKYAHQVSFRPSCRSSDKLFSYMITEVDEKQKLDIKPKNNKLKRCQTQKSLKKQQKFKPSVQTSVSKPSPSIEYFKINLYKKIK